MSQAQLSTTLPDDLRAEIERTGYYPQLICDIVDTAVAGEDVAGFFIHPETTFDQDEVRRHVTVLVVTGTRLVVAHIDDHEASEPGDQAYAMATTEAVALHHVRSVILSHSVAQPAQHQQHKANASRELTLTLAWGSLTRVEMEPAVCPDPECEADHGYAGSMAVDDITLRLSTEAEGPQAVRAAMDFARTLSAGIARAAK